MKNPIRYGEKVAGLSAIALFGFLFMDWFGVTGSTEGASGWDALGWFTIGVCVLAIVAGIALPIVYALYDSPVMPVFVAISCLLLGGLAVIAIVFENVFQPGPDELVSTLSGWWLGLLAAIGISRAGYLSMHDEFMVAVPMPDVEVRPAPAA